MWYYWKLGLLSGGLGIDLLWLKPPFPQHDNGYGELDYCAIDPAFELWQLLKNSVAEADKRSIGAQLDMVLNHVSTEHEWNKKPWQGTLKYQVYLSFKT